MRKYVKALQDGTWKEHLDEGDFTQDTSVTDTEYIAKVHVAAKKLEEGRVAANKQDTTEAQTTNEDGFPDLNFQEDEYMGIQVTMAFCLKGKKRGEIFFPEEYEYTTNEDGKEEVTWAAFAEQRAGQVESYEKKTPAEVYHGHLTYTATINGKRRAAKVKFVDDGMECFCSMDESLKNKWWWYGHWGKDGVTCAQDVHKQPS